MTDARPVAHDVSVIIPTLGGAFLHGCLESIAAGTMWPARVIVIDQGQHTGPAGWIASLRKRGMDVVHLHLKPAGISAATNLGLGHVRTTFAAVTHDDCIVRPRWLERLSARLRTAGDAIVTGRVEPVGNGFVLTVKTSDEQATYVAPLLDGAVLFAPNMAFAVRLLDRIGPFDEHPSLALAGEDNEWAHRALRAGVPIVYEPTVVVGHLARLRREELPEVYRRYALGHGAFYGSWLRRGDPVIARRVVRDLARASWLIVRGIATRNPELAAMGRNQVAGLLPGIMAGLRNPGVRVARARQEERATSVSPTPR